MSRAESLKTMSPQLVADLTLYSTESGGRRVEVLPGWGCPCYLTKADPRGVCYDGWPLLGDEPLAPGERRRVGFVFLSGEAASHFRKAGRFFLWELGFIGEAVVVADGPSTSSS